MAIDNSNLPRYGPDLSALGLRSISSLAEKAGIRQDGNGTKISESNLWVARGKNTQNREWDSEGGREGSPIQEQANTVEAGGTGADLQVTRRFQQQMEIEEMNRKKDTQYLGNSAGQNVGKETKKDKRIVGITLEEGEGEKVIYEKGTGSALKGHFHNLKLKEKGVEPMQVTHKQNKVREIKEMENAEREASESKKPSNSPEERKYWASSTSKPIGINFITEIGLTKGEQNISTMIGIRRKEVEFFKRAMEGDKQDKKEKNELGKRVQGENDLDQRHLWWNYREQAKTVSNYLQAGQQIYSSDDGDLYIVELANEEDEKDEVAKQTESIAETWETELASHINKSLKLKRRRDDEIPMMIEGAENEEEDAESAGLHLRGRKKCRKEAIYEEQEGQVMQIEEEIGKILMAGEAGLNMPPTQP
nr:paralemmin-3-like [Arachis hypogaea]